VLAEWSSQSLGWGFAPMSGLYHGGCSGYSQMAVKWDGGALTLGGKAPASPYRSCHADPHGFITLAPGSTGEFTGYKAASRISFSSLRLLRHCNNQFPASPMTTPSRAATVGIMVSSSGVTVATR
jgi:hypothetical protein